MIITFLGTYLVASKQADTQVRLKSAEISAAKAQSLRKEKLDSFSAFLNASDSTWQLSNDFLVKSRTGSLGEYREESREVVTELTRSYLGVLVASSQKTRDAATKYKETLSLHLQRAAKSEWQDDTATDRKELLDAMREELEGDAATLGPAQK
ncbi:hypothetical protein [Kitasatospora sp. NPDC057198]|uniref:hypothetical protein n=1 Tax=Kitasatospora sp. NPDC057198 TaxID=3346046 RepID=UPI0036370354